jgi:hypothetical protein
VAVLELEESVETPFSIVEEAVGVVGTEVCRDSEEAVNSMAGVESEVIVRFRDTVV